MNCLSFLFLLVCLFLGTVGHSQTAIENTNLTYAIPTINNTLNISKSGYYLSEVIDLRTNPSNNGSIEIKKTKYSLTLPNGLPLHVSSFVFPQNNSSNLSPLSVQIEKMKCFASTDSKSDAGQLYIKLHFIDLSNSRKIKTFENTFNYKKSSKPDFLADFFYTSFRTALLSIKKKTENNDNLTSNTLNYSNTNTENTYQIPLPSTRIKWNNPTYFLTTIEDNRSYSKNEGGVSIGFFNQMAAAKVDSNLEYYVRSMISDSTAQTKKPLSIQINAFRISEQETDKGELGSIYLSVNFLTDSAGVQYSVFNKIIQLDTINEFDITKYWPEIIKQTLTTLLQSFDNQEQKKLSPLSATNSNNEIVVERFYYKHKFYWQGKELKKLSSFKGVTTTNNDLAINKDFNNSINLIRTGRVLNIAGATLLAYSFIDFLQVEDKSFKNWYKSNTYASSATSLATDKKLLVYGGLTAIVSSFILRKIGKSKLLQTVGLYNKSLAKKVSLNFVPDIQKQGYLFQLDYSLGMR